jgi:hypothetical protein
MRGLAFMFQTALVGAVILGNIWLALRALEA